MASLEARIAQGRARRDAFGLARGVPPEVDGG
jgi:hypothetical protein